MKTSLARFSRGLWPILVCALALFAAVPSEAANIVILNNNAAGVGFNDPTPRAPVGGNPGTTLGAQRLFIFNHAAAIWSNILPSNVTIVVRAQFAAQTCTPTSAVLGSAGAVTVHANFTGAPFLSTWYNQALANKLFGSDLSAAQPDINATFNLNIDSGCFGPGQVWYYGIDGLEGTNIELLPVVLHELGHGLGFQTFTNGSTGAYFGTLPNQFPSISDRFLYDTVNGLHWHENTAAQRAASAISIDKLAWDGGAVNKEAVGFLGPRPALFINSPAGIAGTYPAQAATFGAPLTVAGLTGNVVLAEDAVAPINDGCEPLINAAAVAGNIALIDRGLCSFVIKAQQAQAAGAIGLLVANNVAAGLPGMGGTDPSITIPCIGITQAEGNAIKANLAGGVNVTIALNPAQIAGMDANGRVLMYAPNPFQGGSSVSHYDVTLSPNVLMEPAINNDLHDTVDLTPYHFRDLGWFPNASLALSASPPKGACGDKVTLTATVSPPGEAKGTVEFFEGATSLGTVAVVNNNTATLSIPALAVGSYSFTATHSCFTCSTSIAAPKLAYEVNLRATTTTLTSEPNPSGCQQDVTITATVSPDPGGGTVNFFSDGKQIGSAPVLGGGTASITLSTLSVGSHALTATFKGDACNAPSTSAPVTHDVVPNTMAVALSSDMNPSSCSVKVTLRAKVIEPTPPGLFRRGSDPVLLAPPPPTGTVNFFDNGNPIGSVPLGPDSTAVLSVTNFTVGEHSLTATYKGDTCYALAVSDKLVQLVDPFLTTTTLASSPNPSTCGEKVTITATVDPPTATGTVNFADGLNPIGSAPVVNGVATLSVTTFTAGNHSITAEYSGDACYAASLADKINQLVNSAPTTTVVSTSPNPSSCGEKVTLTATVSPPGATGDVNFLDGPNPIGTASLVNGVATLSVTNFTVGIHSIRAVYKGDACYSASGSDNSVDQVVNPAATTTTLASSPNPATCGQKVTLTATVGPSTATGDVNFFDGPNPIGTAPLVNGVATLSVTTFTAGTHPLTARYKGDACYAPSASNTVDQVVGSAPTATTVSSTPNPSACAEKVTITAAVTPAAATGEVNFFDGPNAIGTVTLVNGVATLSITTLAVGVHSITAVYKGDACYAPSTSNKIEQVVRPVITVTTLTSDDLKSECGRKVTLTATVTPATATGLVNFFDGPNPIGSVPLVNGVATLSITTLAVGAHPIIAVYKGDGCFGPSAAGPIQQVVNQVVTTLTLTSDPSPSTCRDDKVTVTATVSPGTATGTVNFFDAGVPIGSVALVNGVAVLSVTTFMSGTHPLTAVYKGDACHATSTGSHEHVRDCPVATLLTLFQAEPVTGAVELRWQYGEPGLFVETRIDRATSPTGPWNEVNAELRRDGDVQVAVDRSVTAGGSYWYRLVARPASGAPVVFGPIAAAAGVSIEKFELASIWPNPTKGMTRVDFTVAKQSAIRLSIVDVQGREVAVLAEGSHRPGRYQAVWTGETARGLAPVGLYFVRYQIPGKVLTGRIALTR